MAPVVAAVAGALLVLAPPTWGVVRHAVTLVHEAGHAIVAVATGRRLNGIRLHRDTSGLTTSVGRPRGPGMVATAVAGYPAPSVLGLGVLALVAWGHAVWAWWAGLVALAIMLLFIRNWFGVVVLLAVGGAVAVLLWRTAPAVQEAAATGFGWLMLAGGLRTTLELWSSRRRSRARTSDADVLARLTHLPAAVWNVLLIAVAVAALVPAWGLLGRTAR